MRGTSEVKIFVGLMCVALAIAGVAVYLFRTKPTTVIRPPQAVAIKPETLMPEWSQVEGSAAAPFTLVEFGDYQCPACRLSEDIVHNIMAAHPGKVKRIFHHCVIVTDHPNAK